ncbi:PREDICTED: uncharacterized protein LOC107191186 [Dufourea novaeangliae]|uniref:uncharacterized protein LOC107191186 n=1 Tax=Dufourea novaeangliae TaxID=178035 RepID=UPI0007676BFA|nr:PREDICTED: uncharacterized protein LOC107191186 [Dufourea novaeangliae]
MLDQFLIKNIKPEDQNDRSISMFDIKSSNLSERVTPCFPMLIPRKICSEIYIQSNVNYDDLCGPWIYPKNPVYGRYVDSAIPEVCVWKYFTKQDVIYLKHYQKNVEMVSALFGKRNYQYTLIFDTYQLRCKRKCNTFTENKSLKMNKEKCNNILKKVLLHSFTQEGVSATLGFVCLTHLFFLSHPWCTAKEVYQFFYESILVHAVLNSPKSVEVFNIIECKLLFEAFHEIYLENLTLLHLLCHPIYHFIMVLSKPLSAA